MLVLIKLISSVKVALNVTDVLNVVVALVGLVRVTVGLVVSLIVKVPKSVSVSDPSDALMYHFQIPTSCVMYDVELQLSAVAPPCKVPFKLLITAVLFGATKVKLTSKISLGVPSASDTFAINCTLELTTGVVGEVIFELITGL